MTDSLSTTRSRWIALFIVLAIVATDQFVKFVVMGPLGLQNRESSLYLLPFFDLTFTPNFGISLGLLEAKSEFGRWALVTLTAAISVGIAWWIAKEKSRGDIVALAIVLGGAIGNIVDRARLGYVIDYADFHIGEIRPFMIFNIADAAITIGVLLLVGRALLQGSEKSKTIATE